MVEDEFPMARRLAEPLKACCETILGPAATIKRALSSLARASRIDFSLLDADLRGATAFAAMDALLSRRVAVAFTIGYGASAIPERYGDAAVHQKQFGKVEIARIASDLVLTASRPCWRML
jgi:hypothetical protein